MRTVAVLGPIPRDRIVTHRGEVFEKYGCALYTVAALSALMEPTDRICPIVHVRKQDEEAIKDLLAPMPNVDLTGIRSDTDRGDIVQLTYEDQNTRIEHQTGFMSPILPSDVEFALDAEAFVCVPSPTTRWARRRWNTSGPTARASILLDGHGPVSTLTLGGERSTGCGPSATPGCPHRHPQDEPGGGGLQLVPPGGRGRHRLDGPADDRVRDAARSPSTACDAGCKRSASPSTSTAAWPTGSTATGELEEHVVPRIPVENVVDTTGCGDSFAAGMAFGYLFGRDIVKACQYGNAMGAQRCAGSELSIYLPRAETDAQIERTYGPMAGAARA